MAALLSRARRLLGVTTEAPAASASASNDWDIRMKCGGALGSVGVREESGLEL